MAEGFARKLAGPDVKIFSAGSQPAQTVNPTAVKAMRERGIDLAGKTPKGFDTLPKGPFDLVVGMGCGDACLAVPAKRTLTWEIPDPKGQPIERVRQIRDEIEGKVKTLFLRRGGRVGGSGKLPPTRLLRGR